MSRNANEAREAVALLLTNKATPKAAIAALEVVDNPHVKHAIEALQEFPWNAKAKAATVIEALLERLDSEEQASARIPEIEAEVKERMAEAGNALLCIGHLLLEAREEFETAKEFISWAESSFGFKKAYTYRLMTVGEAFEADDILAGQSINILHKLAAMPAEVKEQVREKVENGEKVTGASVQKMNGVTEDQPGEGTENGQQGPSEGDEPKGPTKAQAAMQDAESADSGAPWDSGTGKVQGLPIHERPTPVPTEHASDEVRALLETVHELKTQLAAALANKASGKSKPAMPMLAQFKSECHYARLGLSAEEADDAAKVRQAFRAFVKAGYNSQHEAYPALVEAKEALESKLDKVA